MKKQNTSSKQYELETINPIEITNSKSKDRRRKQAKKRSDKVPNSTKWERARWKCLKWREVFTLWPTMRCCSQRNKIFSLSVAFEYFLTVLLAFSGGLLKLSDPKFSDKIPKWAMEFVILNNDYAWLIIPIATVILVLLRSFRSLLGDPGTWSNVHDVLEQLREVAFAERANGNIVSDHRVTLFKATSFHLCGIPFTRMLVPVERSGFLTQTTSVSFYIPDNKRVAGIAGLAWGQNESILKPNLPRINEYSKNQTLARYAKQTNVTVQWLKKELCGKKAEIASRSFLAIPVEVSGKPWGVLVFDSKSGKSIDQPTDNNIYSRLIAVLSNLLKNG